MILEIQKNCIANELFQVLSFKKIMEFKLVHEVCNKKEKQTKKNLQKYVPSSLNQLIYAHVQCREPKRSEKGSNLKEDDRALPLKKLHIILYEYTSPTA